MSELKSVVVLDGLIHHVGEWDFRYETTLDAEGNEIKTKNNPLPEGATIEQRRMIYSMENGWQSVSTTKPPTLEERLAQMEMMLINLLEVL